MFSSSSQYPALVRAFILLFTGIVSFGPNVIPELSWDLNSRAFCAQTLLLLPVLRLGQKWTDHATEIAAWVNSSDSADAV